MTLSHYSRKNCRRIVCPGLVLLDLLSDVKSQNCLGEPFAVPHALAHGYHP